MNWLSGRNLRWVALGASLVLGLEFLLFGGYVLCRELDAARLTSKLLRLSSRLERVPETEREQAEKDRTRSEYRKTLQLLEERGLSSPAMVKQLLGSEERYRFTVGVQMLPKLKPADAVSLFRDLWRSDGDMSTKYPVVAALAEEAKPGYSEAFSTAMFDEDFMVRSLATYGLFQVLTTDEFLKWALESLDTGLEIMYLGTGRPPSLHAADGWNSAAGYLAQVTTKNTAPALASRLSKPIPAFIRADVLRALLEGQSQAGVDYCRASISSEDDPACWKYMARTILHCGTREEKAALLSGASELPKAKIRGLGEAAAEELASFHLPFRSVHGRPALEAAIVNFLRERGKTSGAYGHVLEHLPLVPEESDREGEIHKVDIKGEIDRKIESGADSRADRDFEALSPD